jgi:hypothetical protein
MTVSLTTDSTDLPFLVAEVARTWSVRCRAVVAAAKPRPDRLRDDPSADVQP